MVLNKLTQGKEINEELMRYEDVRALWFRLKKIPGMIVQGYAVQHEEFHLENGNQFAVVVFHGAVTDEQLKGLNLKPYVFPDEIEEIFYVDSLDSTLSETAITNNRIRESHYEICRELELR